MAIIDDAYNILCLKGYTLTWRGGSFFDDNDWLTLHIDARWLFISNGSPYTYAGFRPVLNLLSSLGKNHNGH